MTNKKQNSNGLYMTTKQNKMLPDPEMTTKSKTFKKTVNWQQNIKGL